MARDRQAARRLSSIDTLLVVELLAMGTVTGFLAGMLGIGGGMIQVPVLTLLLAQRGVPDALAIKMAIATGMASIVFTSISSVRAHQARGAVRWDIARAMVPGILLGGLLAGAGVFALVKGPALGFVFALFVGYSATQMLLERKPKASRSLPGPLGLSAAGGVVGLVSGVVGAGGAFISVPFMLWCNVVIHQAVGTSAALGFPIAAASTLGYLIGGWSLPPALPGAFGYLWLPALAIVSAASVVMAPVGARVAHGMDTRAFRRVFAVLLYGVAGFMAWRALR